MTNPLAQDLGGVVLLPCPFCGGCGEVGGLIPWVECQSCEASGPQAETEGAAISAWNTRAHSAEIAGALRDAERWQPIESAPTQGVIELAVVSEKGEERRTMVAERSFRDGEPYWMVTHGWVGWTTLHPGWTPYAWRPLPAPPTQDSAMQQGGGGG